ncbi:MAG: hypothetical protein AAF555_10975 [Verrucomicrobiota bacterium]
MSSSPSSIGRSGAALLIVFWLIGALSLIIAVSLKLLKQDLDTALLDSKEFRATQLAETGLALAAHPDVEKEDPLLVRVYQNGVEGYRVRLTTEAAKINPNYVLIRGQVSLLSQLFLNWGLDETEATEVAESLKDWVDEDELAELNGAERDWYLEQEREGYPFDRPFYNLDEMALSRGMERVAEVRPDWRSFFSLLSRGPIDVNHADAETLAAAAEVPLDAARSFVELRVGPDLLPETEDDLLYQSVDEALGALGSFLPADQRADRFTVNDSMVRIESTGWVDNFEKTVVLVLQSKSPNPIVMSRREQSRLR